MKRFRFLLVMSVVTMTAFSLSGCKWDDGSYTGYVDGNEDVISCPPLMDMDNNGELYIPMNYIRCYRNWTVPENAQIEYLTEYKKCLNYQRNWDRLNGLLGFIGYMENRPFSDGFKHDICPAEYSTCIYDEERALWGCVDCLPGYVKCGETCIDPLTDSNYCGADNTCQNANHCASNQVCMQGKCQVNTCASHLEFCGIDDCRNIHAKDPANCGGCDYKCREHPTATAESNTCLNGVCQYECKNDYTNCGGSKTAKDIVCIETRSFNYNKEHCGGCNNPCNFGEVCLEGRCQLNTCSGNQTLCAVGDCRDTQDNPNNCGSCDHKCSDYPKANANFIKCESGECKYRCDEGYVNINTGNDSNPECINPMTDPRHCGNGLVKCNDDMMCENGECVRRSCQDSHETLCPPRENSTERYCANLKNSVSDCGFCGYQCPSPDDDSNMIVECSDSQCDYKCKNDPNIRDCNPAGSQTLNCVNVAEDPKNCGSCGNACNPKESCVDGNCHYTGCTESYCIEYEHAEPGYSECDVYDNCSSTKCQLGYHLVEDLFNKICERNTNDACGSRAQFDFRPCPTNSVYPYTCSDEEERCVIVCAEGMHPNDSNDDCLPDSPQLDVFWMRSLLAPSISRNIQLETVRGNAANQLKG